MATIERFLPADERKSRPSRLREKRIEQSTHSDKKRMSLDPRRVIGSVLILLSVGGGYFTVMKADQRKPYVALAHPMAAGQIIEASDLVEIRAALPPAVYAQSKSQLVGQTLSQSADSGEVIALSSIAQSKPYQLVAIPIKVTNLPTLSRGDQVALWSDGQLVLSQVAVDSLARESTTQVLTLAVPEELVPGLIPALGGELVVVKLP